MYKYMVILILVISIGCSNELNKKNILDIKKEYRVIQNSLDTYSVVEYNDINLDSFNETKSFLYLGTIDIKKYIDKSQIKKIVVNFNNGSTDAISEYYYANQKLFFVYRKIDYYKNKKFSTKYKKKYNRYEYRFYFVKDKMIRWLMNKEKISKKKINEWCEKEKDILKDAYNYLKITK